MSKTIAIIDGKRNAKFKAKIKNSIDFKIKCKVISKQVDTFFDSDSIAKKSLSSLMSLSLIF